MSKTNCTTCNTEVNKKTSWKLNGRDSEDVSHFCSDSCRMMFPFKKSKEEDK